ncbi:MAG: antitoxin VbhA family protein [Acidobacteriaceae bacterium]|jgi:hypothetical protein
MAPITEEEKRHRREGNASVLGTHAMEGLFPDAETVALMDRYAEGEFTIEEFSTAMDLHVKKLVADAQERQATSTNGNPATA